MRVPAPSTKSRRVARSLLLPVAFILVLLPLSSLRTTFEYDGVMQSFAGREIFAGAGYVGWAAQFWPPLYSLLIGLGGLVLSEFAAAKLISVVSGSVLLFVAYHLATSLSGRPATGLLTQSLLFVNPLFVSLAIQAENHMLDALFFVSALLVVVRAFDGMSVARFFAAGLLAGLAMSTRYTSYPLLLTAPLLIVMLGAREGWRGSLAFLAGASLVCLPWWCYNAAVNGSPLHTWQYANVGYAVTWQQRAPNHQKWWWSTQEGVDGLCDVVSAYPRDYLENFLRNLYRSGLTVFAASGVAAPFVAAGLVESLFVVRSRLLALLWALFASYVLLVSQAFVFGPVFLMWVVVALMAAALLFVLYWDRLAQRVDPKRRARLAAVALGALLAAGGLQTAFGVARLIGDRNDVGAHDSSRAIGKILRERDPAIAGKYVMCTQPAVAYHSGARFLFIPQYYEGTVAGLVAYEGLGERVRARAPRHPWEAPDSGLRADYLVYDATALGYLPQFAFLLDPSSAEIPENFEPIYRSGDVAVYAIRK